MSDVFELTLTDIANGGQAVGRHEGKTIFVPYTIPGETITVRITQDRGRYAFAEGLTVLDLSADRVTPRCPHFGPGKCGKCQWQHIDYQAQLALKTDIVIDQLSRVGHFEDPHVLMTIGSPKFYEYRTRTTLYQNKEGKLGYISTDGKTIFPIEECHIITPELFALFEQMDFDLAALIRVTMVDNGEGDQMLILSTSDDEPPSLEIDFKASVNFQLSDEVPVNLIGATHLVYTLLGRRYRIVAGASLRPNIAQVETMLRVIRDWLKPQGVESVLNLYSGSGIFAGMLAPDVSLITCIDDFPPAMTDAEENLAEYDHIDLIEADPVEALENLVGGEHYHIGIIDAPADGLEKEVVDALGAVAPDTLIYIGDDPATMGRDLRRLVERQHYQLERVQPIDFEPQSYHVVCVAQLKREQE